MSLNASMIQTIKAIKNSHQHILSNSQIHEIYDSLKIYEPKTKEERLINVSKIRQQRNISFEKRISR